jgi:hypothetical protein
MDKNFTSGFRMPLFNSLIIHSMRYKVFVTETEEYGFTVVENEKMRGSPPPPPPSGLCGYLYVIIYTKNSYMYLSQN